MSLVLHRAEGRFGLLIILLILTGVVNGQGRYSASDPFPIWDLMPVRANLQAGVREIILRENDLKSLFSNRHDAISISWLNEKGGPYIADLELQSRVMPVILINGSPAPLDQYHIPLEYRGKLRGESAQHDILLTIGDGFTSMQAYLPTHYFSVEPLYTHDTVRYVQVDSRDFRPDVPVAVCGMPDVAPESPRRILDPLRSSRAPEDQCIYAYVECTDDFVTQNGNDVQSALNNLYAIWSGVATAYSNESINMLIGQVNFWDIEDPYDTSNRDSALMDFAFAIQDNFWGNFGLLLDETNPVSNPNGNSGIAGGFGKLKAFSPNQCGTFDSSPPTGGFWGSYVYADMNYFGNYQNFPVPDIAEEVYLTTHEIGHLLNSRHTHWCGWPITPDSLGALDNCSTVEGICPPGPTPTNGGSFMSYCLGTGQFMNFNVGFDSLPGNVIRSFVDDHACLVACVTCSTNVLIEDITGGFHVHESSNFITANGVISSNAYVRMDAQNSVTLMPGFRANLNTKVQIIVDGCGGIR